MLMPSGVGMVEDGEGAGMEDTVVTEEDMADGEDTEDTADGMAVNSTTEAWRMFNMSLLYNAIAIKLPNVVVIHTLQ
jgi:hypothetical protein